MHLFIYLHGSKYHIRIESELFVRQFCHKFYSKMDRFFAAVIRYIEKIDRERIYKGEQALQLDPERSGNGL